MEARPSIFAPSNVAISTSALWRVSLFAILPATLAAGPKPAFFKDVLPILQNRCQECHRPGEIAPMPLLTYPGVRPWAKAIRDAVLTRRMPPWFADPRFGHFANDRSLSKNEIETIVEWVDAGAAEGNPKDAPPARAWQAGWSIGAPDAIFEMPEAVRIPAKGTIEYQYVILPTRFTDDKWVEKVEVQPSDRSSVHHAVVYIRESDPTWLRNQPIGRPFSLPANNHRPNPASLTTSDILMVYTPGNSSDGWPRGMAKKIKAGSDLVLQMHYTANGKDVADRTRIGVVFAKEPPMQAVLTLQMGNDKFVIPPGDANFRIAVSGTLPNQATLISLFPHMHLRGKRFEYLLVEPNGRIETLLKVNDYDFNWQLNYRLAQPRVLPASTRFQWVGYFDNSPNNPRNPDPKAEVRFGEQSWEEMMIGFFDMAVDPKIGKPAFFERKR